MLSLAARRSALRGAAEPYACHACWFRLRAPRWVWFPQIRAALMSGDVWYCLAKSGDVGTWSGTGSPDVSPKGGTALEIGITDDTMTLKVDNRIVSSRLIEICGRRSS